MMDIDSCRLPIVLDTLAYNDRSTKRKKQTDPSPSTIV